jgi:uncharacterized protein YfeS
MKKRITFEVENITYTWCEGLLYNDCTDEKRPLTYDELYEELCVLRRYTDIEENIRYEYYG